MDNVNDILSDLMVPDYHICQDVRLPKTNVDFRADETKPDYHVETATTSFRCQYKTRKHSSRMRIGRFPTVSCRVPCLGVGIRP